MLSRFKLSYADIRKAILSVNDAILSVDDLKAISKHLPMPEEVRETFSLYSAVDVFSHFRLRACEMLMCLGFQRRIDTSARY